MLCVIQANAAVTECIAKNKDCNMKKLTVFFLATLLSLVLIAPGIAGAVIVYDGIVDTYATDATLINSPSVIAEITGSGDISALSNVRKPSSVIVHIDQNLNVVDKGGNVIGVFDDIFITYLAFKSIPVIYIKDNFTAESLLNYLRTQRDITDMAVMSDNPQLVKKIREENTKIRGIIDYSGEELEENLQQIVAQTNMAYANIAVLSQSQASYETVDYLQKRLTTVWVKADSSGLYDISTVISAGAYGIITESSHQTYNILRQYTGENALSRTPYNVAHRGMPLTSYENSLEGGILAYQSGATHIEIDTQITSDDKLVIMHDTTINRTTNGSGTVSNMTLAQIQQYKIIKNVNGVVMGTGVNIPQISDFFEYFQDKDVIIVLEVKDNNAKHISLLREEIEEHSFWDKIVVISFFETQLLKMKEIIPEIPTAYLGNVTSATFAAMLKNLGVNNTAVNTNKGNASKKFIQQLKDRGYMSWFWTYELFYDVNEAIINGVTGITNNSAGAMQDYVRQFKIDGKYLEDKYYIADKAAINSAALFDAEIVTYGGETKKVSTAVAAASVLSDEYATIILKYEFSTPNKSVTYTLFSQPVKVIFSEYFMSVSTIIYSISGLPDDITLDDQDLVAKIRKALNLLDAEDKALITNVEKLIEAENTLLALSDELPQETQPQPQDPANPLSIVIVIAVSVVGVAGIASLVLYVIKKKKI